MIFKDNKTGLHIYPHSDKNIYNGAMTIKHKSLEGIDINDPKFTLLQVTLSNVITKFLDNNKLPINYTEIPLDIKG